MLNKFASSALACLVLSSTALAQSAPIVSPTPFSSHYIVTRLDLRKCAYPVCGGYFVKAVNRALTRCANGTLQKDCHVATLNTSALRWSPEDRDAFEQSFTPGHALAGGKLVALKNGATKVDTLVISEAWVGQALSKPSGVFSALKNSGIVCITTPCPSIRETVLNYPIGRNIHGLDLAASGAKPDRVDAGFQALGSTGVLAVGTHQTITGPAGQGQQFVASEFYLPFVPAKIR
ncbi:MAG: hypothetical protein Q7V20_01730 [Aquabacterium sp.]|uniref:DUF6748 domain-containing protein n=1 Tax=Aquabacterium sp. TaxID=1872578 RepID=UPI0027218137|nr:DUF6748 domain-containing protein [Aquabacterium sp.]MDO9002154.1 hypothetical protein [Aquabacterium sp.]